MSFSTMTSQLQAQLKSNLPQILMMLKNNPAMAYTKITEIGHAVGDKYNVRLLVNFPHDGKINEYEFYGKRDLSIIVDRLKTNFPIPRQTIREKAQELFPNAEIEDAYMYEGKEGLRIKFEGGRIDILPHSLHIWCVFDDTITQFCDWLLTNVYDRGQTK
ncbi:MAG: hypothetical protein EB150_00335 [Nitrososphaeria archaeon]|nr:hypothetical protein [Nitrososphaeria archaeon]NDB50952.1 hypothetical protein [Nitrosopumilaceae archaeon]NDB88418.1 hypothetical protein [Nitrososphaerota archaeon]NDB46949.1 hypothetical protein [Nitrososphaeria archaeon]NDB90399.1 hypothetical protein [Nitrososphaerota archaeon]